MAYKQMGLVDLISAIQNKVEEAQSFLLCRGGRQASRAFKDDVAGYFYSLDPCNR